MVDYTSKDAGRGGASWGVLLVAGVVVVLLLVAIFAGGGGDGSTVPATETGLESTPALPEAAPAPAITE